MCPSPETNASWHNPQEDFLIQYVVKFKRIAATSGAEEESKPERSPNRDRNYATRRNFNAIVHRVSNIGPDQGQNYLNHQMFRQDFCGQWRQENSVFVFLFAVSIDSFCVEVDLGSLLPFTQHDQGETNRRILNMILLFFLALPEFGTCWDSALYHIILLDYCCRILFTASRGRIVQSISNSTMYQYRSQDGKRQPTSD